MVCRVRLSSGHRRVSISCRVREGFVMRLAIVGTAAAAAIGGTLAVAPLTLSTPERVAGGTCSAGQQCDRLAAVLMPDTATPSGPAAAEHAVPAPFEPVRRTRSRRDWFRGRVYRRLPPCPGWARQPFPAYPTFPVRPARPCLPHRPCRTWPRRAYLASASRASASRASASRASASPAYPTQSPG